MNRRNGKVVGRTILLYFVILGILFVSGIQLTDNQIIAILSPLIIFCLGVIIYLILAVIALILGSLWEGDL